MLGPTNLRVNASFEGACRFVTHPRSGWFYAHVFGRSPRIMPLDPHVSLVIMRRAWRKNDISVHYAQCHPFHDYRGQRHICGSPLADTTLAQACYIKRGLTSSTNRYPVGLGLKAIGQCWTRSKSDSGFHQILTHLPRYHQFQSGVKYLLEAFLKLLQRRKCVSSSWLGRYPGMAGAAVSEHDAGSSNRPCDSMN